MRIALAVLFAVCCFPQVGISQSCHSSYAEICVPVDDDVDCAGGIGDGPAWVQGPFLSTADDPYDLDRDNDGIACEPHASHSAARAARQIAETRENHS